MAASDISGKIAIVGVAESDQIGKVPDVPAIMLHAQAARTALAEAGLTLDDVDGLFTAGITTLELGEYLGIRPKYADGGNVGGSSFVIHVGHAASAIATGRCEVALITHGESGRSRVGHWEPEPPPYWISSQHEAPYGLILPGSYALAAARHMHEYGTTHEQLAEIAVATRKWAALNPKAYMKDPITIEDVLNSRPIAYPLNLLDCCLVTDAGGAIVMTSMERAKSLKSKPVSVLGVGESHGHAIISQMPDLTSFAAKESGAQAMAMAGVKHADLDLAMIYDSFTYTVLVTLEDLGFCAKGEGGAFVSGQRTAPGGAFPMNTNGGGLSYNHPGMYGIFAVIEAVRQVRGDYQDQGIRQVPDCELAIVHGTGWYLSSAGTAVLGRA
jgi:acetyl-CoA acetyltransferase